MQSTVDSLLCAASALCKTSHSRSAADAAACVKAVFQSTQLILQAMLPPSSSAAHFLEALLASPQAAAAAEQPVPQGPASSHAAWERIAVAVLGTTAALAVEERHQQEVDALLLKWYAFLFSLHTTVSSEDGDQQHPGPNRCSVEALWDQSLIRCVALLLVRDDRLLDDVVQRLLIGKQCNGSVSVPLHAWGTQVLGDAAYLLTATAQATDSSTDSSTERGGEMPRSVTVLPAAVQEHQVSVLMNRVIAILHSSGSAPKEVCHTVKWELYRRVLLPLSATHAAAANGDGVLEFFLEQLKKNREEGGRHEEEVMMVLLTAFDILFCETASVDLRSSNELWESLLAALQRSMNADPSAATSASTDGNTMTSGGHESSAALRVCYVLKRIVHYTSLTHPPASADTSSIAAPLVHPLFTWDAEQSPAAWSSFFLALESANEFNLHMVLPVLKRVDQLVESSSCNGHPLLGVPWLEVLLRRLLQHPNTAIRKVVLRRIWREWGPQHFSSPAWSLAFLFSDVYLSAADARLCVELDRVPIAATFLDMKAFEGEELCATMSSTSEPIATAVERLYGHLFVHRSKQPSDRIEALRLLLTAVRSQQSRFSLSVFIRLFGRVCIAWREEATTRAGTDGEAAGKATLAAVFHEDTLRVFTSLFCECIEDNCPFWLQVRLTASLFHGLLQLTVVNPEACRGCPGFWQLLARCGSLGGFGGKACAMDAVGGIASGPSGGACDIQYFNECLRSLSAEVSSSNSWKPGSSSLTDRLLGRGDMLRRTEELMNCPTISIVDCKRHFFLAGALDIPFLQQLLRCILNRVGDASLAVDLRRAAFYALTAFHEAVHSEGQVADHYLDVAVEDCTPLHHLFTTTEAFAVSLVEAVLQTISAEGVATAGVTSPLEGPCYQWLSTENWEALVAAIATLRQLALKNQYHSATAPAITQTACSHLPRLFRALEEVNHVQLLQGKKGGAAFRRLVQHRVLLLLQAITVYGDEAAMRTLTAKEGATAEVLIEGYCQCLIDCQETAPSSSSSTESSVLLGDLQQNSRSLLMPLVSPPPVWPEVNTVAERCVCDVLYVLCTLPQDSATSGHSTALLNQIESFCLSEVERCWSVNLPSVYHLLLWLCSTAPSASRSEVEANDDEEDCGGVHREEILTCMRCHLNDLGAMQQARLSVLYFSALRASLPYAPDHVVLQLLTTSHVTLKGKEAKNRFVFASQSAKASTKEAAEQRGLSPRDVYLLSITAALSLLDILSAAESGEEQPDEDTERALLAIVLHFCIFYSPPKDAENESTQAVMEPAMAAHWPEALRLQYPGSVNLALLGRAMSIASLLWYVQHHPDRSTPGDLTLALLRISNSHPILSSEPCMPNSETHRCRLRLWQLVCALTPLLRPEATDMTEVFSVLLKRCIPTNNLGSVRRLMEVYAIELLRREPSLYATLSEALGILDQRPQAMGSLVLIAGHTLLSLEEQASTASTKQQDRTVEVDQVFDALFPRLQQQGTSHQHLLRIISHIAIYRVCLQREQRHGKLSPDTQSVFAYIRDAEEHKRFREKHEAMLFYDVQHMASIRSIFCLQRKEANMVLCDGIPASLFERIRDVEHEVMSLMGSRFRLDRLRTHHEWGSAGVQRHLSNFATFPYIPHTAEVAVNYPDFATDAWELLWSDPLGEKKKSQTVEKDANVQLKAVPWWVSEVHNELHPRAIQVKRHTLVVVASLLENPVNVAGLCRCADIFAIESLIVADSSVFAHPHFAAVARSAELWVPWQAVTPANLPSYFASMKLQGYTIVGVEQTAESVPIQAFKLPEKSVLVLGSEGQGIAPPLIPLLDACVEIPQYGLVRSLNVHVTGAIMMHEYALQHRIQRVASQSS